MYCLTAAAGDRWNLTTDPETKSAALFQRHIQSIERMADAVEYLLSELLVPRNREFQGEAFWRHSLARVAEFLEEEGKGRMEEIAPEGYETLVSYYDFYAAASAETAEAIDAFLDGVGMEAGIAIAFMVLQAHNNARDLYLESIDFPAWLLPDASFPFSVPDVRL